MELYSSEDAEYLMKYYAPKMVGGLLEESTQSKVLSLYKEDYGNNKYRVNGLGSAIKGNVRPYRSIDKIAITQGLLSTNEVLKSRDQTK